MELATVRVSSHETQIIQAKSRAERGVGGVDVLRGFELVSQGTALDNAISRCKFDAFRSVVQPGAKPFRHSGGIQADSAFPDDSNPPSGGNQCRHAVGVPLLVSAKLAVPKVGSGLRQAKKWAAVVSVPEAAVHEDHRAPFGKDHVRLSGKPLGMKAISESVAPQKGSDLHLR